MTTAIDAMAAAMIADWPEPLVIDRGPAPLFGEPDEAWFNKARTHRYLLRIGIGFFLGWLKPRKPVR